MDSRYLALTLVPGLGPRWFLNMAEQGIPIEAFFSKNTFSKIFAHHFPPNRPLPTAPDWDMVERILRWSERGNHHLLSPDMVAYPPLLRHISDPPPILYGVGHLSALQPPALAIIGSRKASKAGLKTSKQYAAALGKEGFSIVSGLARGVDGQAHQGALIEKAPTIAVLAHGMHMLYPPEHLPLARQIIDQQGLLLSEFALGVNPHKSFFPRRNRIISGLCQGVLVIEAGIKSGSLITARYALEQGREVFALPGPISSSLTKGCHVLIREGATLIENLQHILDELPHRGGNAAQPFVHHSGPAQTVLAEQQ